jgi:hypothetical protein
MTTALGGFPWRCFDTCETPADCVMDGCIKLWLETYVKDKLEKYVGQKNTPALREQVVADLLLSRTWGRGQYAGGKKR